MAKVITTIKAILTRFIFSAHSLIAVWQVTQNKKDPIFWALCGPIGLLAMEGVFTLAIKKNQEWRWFCPSVFLYLGSVVPAIWLLELDKVEKRINAADYINPNLTIVSNINNLNELLGTKLHIPKFNVDAETWTTLIEQFLMLILIVGRWLLPKGDLTRDQLSQLLLVYIGTAADIIEFFDSYKDKTIAKESLLVYLTLGIWSWSLLQFTIVLSATRSRKTRGGGFNNTDEETDCCGNCCCGIDVWGIALNVILQDAPFLTFRLLIIVHYKIINYMNVFFTCKNSLVILLQLYRLYVVNSEYWKTKQEFKHSAASKQCKSKRLKKKTCDDYDEYYTNKDIYMISSGKYDKKKQPTVRNRLKDDSADEYINAGRRCKTKKDKYKKRNRKDTGYSTASSQNIYSTKLKDEKFKQHHRKKDNKKKHNSNTKDHLSSSSDMDIVISKKKIIKSSASSNKKDDERYTRKDKQFDAVMEESDTTESSNSTHSSMKYEIVNEKKKKKKRQRAISSSNDSSGSSTSSSSSSST